MSSIDRRALLGAIVSGAAAASVGLTWMPGLAESAPLAGIGAAPSAKTQDLIEQAVVVVRRRPVRRRVCWWRRGRRVCTWR
ncbi:MAG TPA: hypothetical protein VEQ35_01545, partial [Beijerinckia sp.]|jgi:hypothetical protein|nr:hypothetical protein [Beijerinckia sp.]